MSTSFLAGGVGILAAAIVALFLMRNTKPPVRTGPRNPPQAAALAE
ncbi:hypothetical protein OH799_24080 [Nocardia sp. NBC_00881]|nr:hypothetical protein OH799_24080 [Nocardia sp. NBC_00881]